MKTVPVNELRKGDTIQFAERGTAYELAGDPQVHSFEHSLRVLKFTSNGPGDVMMPGTAEVFVTHMHRIVEVSCLLHTPRTGNKVKVIVDLAASPVPRGVLCGDCDEKVTVEVMAQMGKVKGE